MLGVFEISRDGHVLPLPASRKLRALVAYLALAARPAGRGQLCELLWDVPNDPRGELRWCLSKIRGLLDTPGHRRVIAHDDAIRLDLDDCSVDAIEIARAARDGIETLPLERQRALAALFTGDFLEGLEIDRNPGFAAWLTAQRRRFRSCHAALLEQLALRLPDDEALAYLEKWQQLAPFDRRVHEQLLVTLARSGRIREGEAHLAATVALFEAEGLDSAPIREAWRASRAPPPQVVVEAVAHAQAATEGVAATARRASIAVMPLADVSPAPQQRGGLAAALAHDITTRLAKLRSLFVIAQGSTMALHERRIGPEEAGRMLNVDYVLAGVVRVQAAHIAVTVELVETRTARIVWSEILNQKLGDTFLMLEQIGNRIVASIAAEIEALERNRAILRPPASLDAWEAHHRGLWHMYRFTRADNEQAQHFFATAVRLDPTFSRAWAGLSFTHFQNAFQGWQRSPAEMDRAYHAAGQSLMADDRDPAAHWAMGRALWLRGGADQAVLELEQAVDLSPNFAMAHYMLAFVRAQTGDADAAIASSDRSRTLSPYDPLLFAMLGARALALTRLGRFEEAADWATKAAARPNAHVHIHAIAAFCNALAGAVQPAQAHAAAVRRLWPHYGIADFLGAFRLDDDGAARFRRGAAAVGMA
ncbi:transcriptional regulator [Fontimonas sp. SYSU GA230001]|uniref:transcriptional regulator n=1 Tax=Fontimonas sp. SYSU GA230001 TaxID=3142450 RepID=UPI0032B43498